MNLTNFKRFSCLFLCLALFSLMLACKSETETHEIIFDPLNGESLSRDHVEAGSNMTEPAVPVKHGYRFLGWQYNNTDVWDFATDVVEDDVYLTAVWEANQYDIVYHLDGGTNHVDNPSTFVYGHEIVIPESPTRFGYRFIGWHLNQTMSDEAFWLRTSSIAQDIDLYAAWERESYHIYYNYTYPRIQTIQDVFLLHSDQEGASYGYALTNENRVVYWPLTDAVSPDSVPDNFYLYPGWEFMTGNRGSYFGLSEYSTVYAWGLNHVGQLGDGTTVDRDHRLDEEDELEFPLLNDQEHITSIVTSGYHSFAMTNQNRIYAWGNNAHGELGDGTTISRLTPVLISIPGLHEDERIVSLHPGYEYTLALTSDGRILGWGSNAFRRLGGYGEEGTGIYLSPIETDNWMLNDGEVFVDVFAGQQTSFAITDSGDLYGFGSNETGLMARAVSEAIYSPVIIAIPILDPGETVVSVHASLEHALAVTSTGRVYSWGLSNSYGQLGDRSTTGTTYTTPVEVPFLQLHDGETIVRVRAYGHSSFAISSDGRLFAWGQNQYNQLGINNNDHQSTPVLWDDIYINDTTFVHHVYLYEDPIDVYVPTIPDGMAFSGWYVDYLKTIPYTETISSAGYINVFGTVTWSDSAED